MNDSSDESLSDGDADGAAEGASEGVKRRSRPRSIIAVVLIVVGSILSPIAVDAIWARNLALDTDRFVAQLGPLADDPEIQQAIVDRVSVDLLDSVDLQAQIEEALPEDLSLLSLPVDTAIRELVRRITTTIVESEQFSQLWKQLLEVSHSSIVAFLTGDTDVVNAQEGVVSLDLSSIRSNVIGRLQETGLGVFDDLDPDKEVSLEILESDALASAQGFVSLLETLAWVFPVAVLGLYLLGIAVANDRRRAVVGVGLGLAIAMVVHVIVLALGRSFYLEAVTGTLDPGAAAAMFDLLIRAPRIATRVAALVGLVIAGAGYLAGPGRAAVRTRAVFKAAAGKGSEQLSDVGGPMGTVGSFVDEHLRVLQGVVAGVAVVVLLAVGTLTGTTVLWVVIGVIVALFVLQVLAGLGRNPEQASL